MSCHGCAGKFGILNKELGCPSCGFAYCNKCLRFKTIIPKLSSKQQYKVCRSCYNKLTSDKPNEDVDPEPPEAFLRRLELLDDPSRPPITVYRHSQKLEKLKSGLEDADREIVERLEKLKQERRQQLQRMPTDDEMLRRLATLKGEDPDVVAASSKKTQLYMAPDARSSEEKVRGLLEQYTDLQHLDSKRPNPADEIAERLAKLRGESSPAKKPEDEESKDQGAEVKELNKDPMSLEEADALIAQIKSELQGEKEEEDSSDVLSCLRKLRSKLTKTANETEADSDEEGEADRIIQKAIDEIALEEDLDELELSQVSESDKEELPWCIICNEDATIRCLDCERDLYCSSCFRQGHDEWEMRDHRQEPYSKPESQTKTQQPKSFVPKPSVKHRSS